MPRLDSTDFETWKREVDKAMVQKFAIDATDAGLDADELLKHWQQEPSPVLLHQARCRVAQRRLLPHACRKVSTMLPRDLIWLDLV